MQLKVVTLPTFLPVSLDDLKTHLKLDGILEDDLLLMHIHTARSIVEAYVQRFLCEQTVTAHFDVRPTKKVQLPYSAPLKEVISVKYTPVDGVTVNISPDHFVIDANDEPGTIYLNNSDLFSDEPQPGLSVQITYTAGYPDAEAIPMSIQYALLIICAVLYEHREGEVGIPEAAYHLLTNHRVLGPIGSWEIV